MFIYKYRNLLLIIILLIGFGLRFLPAVSIPLNWDEEESLASVENMMESKQTSGSLYLLREDSDTGPVGGKFIVYAMWQMFGTSRLGARLPFVVCAVAIILIVYFLTKPALGVKTALLSSFLLSISQYDIGISRYASDIFLAFFAVTSLFLFYRALLKRSNIFMFLSGLSMGIGFWFKENVFILIPIYITFLLVCREYRYWLKNKYLWFSFGAALFLALPDIFLFLNIDSSRVEYLDQAVRVGWSINAIAVYLGELILLLLKPFGDFYNYVVSSLDSQFPMVNFLFGVTILIAVGKSVLDKRPFIRLLVICFLFNFVPFMFLRGGTEEIDSFWCLSNLDWSILNFIPGVILAAVLLKNFMVSRNKYRILLVSVFCFFLLVRTFHFVSFPLSYCFPAMDYSLELQFETRGMHYLEKGEVEKAKDIFKRIYNVTQDGSEYKKKAALHLAEILNKEGKYKESKEYLHYLFSQDSGDEKALRLLKNGKEKVKN